MGALGNPHHERFAQALHRRLWAGEKRAVARSGAYLEAIHTPTPGAPPAQPVTIAANARRLANQSNIAARVNELAEYAGKLAGIDSAWALVRLKDLADANLADYLGPPDGQGARFFDLSQVGDEQLGRLSQLEIKDETKVGAAENSDDRRILTTKLKVHDPIAAIGLMARIAGWLAPEKREIEMTNLAEMVEASYRAETPAASKPES